MSLAEHELLKLLIRHGWPVECGTISTVGEDVIADLYLPDETLADLGLGASQSVELILFNGCFQLISIAGTKPPEELQIINLPYTEFCAHRAQ